MPRASLVIVVGLLAVAIAPPAGETSSTGGGRPRQAPTSIAALLDRYQAGDYAALRDAAVNGRDMPAFVRTFVDDAPHWIDANGPADAAARRFRAAGAVLEIAWGTIQAVWDNDGWQARWAPMRGLIEWACGQVRRGASTALEEHWLLASVELLLARPDLPFLEGPPRGLPRYRQEEYDRLFDRHLDHLGHAEARFPGNATFRLVRRERANEGALHYASNWVADGRSISLAGFEELQAQAQRIRNRFAMDDRVRHPDDMNVLDRAKWLTGLTEIRTDITPLVDAEDVRGQVHFDLAVIALCFADWPRAQEHLAALDRVAGEVDLRYLGRFLAGRLQRRAGRTEAAEAAYRAALDLRPGTRSATAALAELLFTSDRRDEAAALSEGLLMLTRPRPTRRLNHDPWDQFAGRGFLETDRALQRFRTAIAR